jgi:hypothetical protein
VEEAQPSRVLASSKEAPFKGDKDRHEVEDEDDESGDRGDTGDKGDRGAVAAVRRRREKSP